MTSASSSESGAELSPLRRLETVLYGLREYLPDIVVIGGWVPTLYRLYGNLPTWEARLSGTTECDLLLNPEVSPGTRPPIATLLTRAGIQPVGTGGSFAVWQAEPTAGGERIEFLVSHRGTARKVGTVVPVAQQERLGAIAIPDLEILRDLSQVLQVPTRSDKGPSVTLPVRVPLLGAFVVTRGAIYLQRPATTPREKRGKDLVYIHDILAAGDAVRARVSADVQAMVKKSKRTRAYVRYAATQLSLGVKGDVRAIDDAAALLVEREGMEATVARASIVGFVEDLVEMLRETL